MTLLAAGSYWDIRGYEGYNPRERDKSNHSPIPDGWRVLPEEVSSSGRNLQEDYGSGFSALAPTKSLSAMRVQKQAKQAIFFDPPAKSSSLYKQKILAWRMNFDKNLNAATMACKTCIWKQPCLNHPIPTAVLF